MKKVSRGGRATSAFLLAASMALLISCGRGQGPASQRQLIVFNAGSLTSPVADLLNEFARLHPGITPLQESSGSLEAARKITELGKPCDVLAVADYEVVPSMVMPQHADWYLIFARNQLTLIYTPKSKFSDQINSDNWYEILQRPGVQYGYSNPDLDPAGYRTLLHWQLAEKYYGKPGLYDKLRSGVPEKNIRPKSVELVALLQSGELDYIYCYRSIAEQNKLPFLHLPAEIDFSDAGKIDYYAAASTEVAGKKPGERLRIKGMPIQYGLTIPKAAPNRDAAEEFVEFMLSPQGQEIMQQKHLMTVSPALASDTSKLPARLQTRVAQIPHD
ncbi:MAG TPA: tungstate ABC transporter substrate-binding protein WtpA [Blastocatellia bacterium]|nr:tungstate ABC transporter substrate-binding protein WtpA [Blastocatellia bacterium]